jgi:hypothetical protein
MDSLFIGWIMVALIIVVVTFLRADARSRENFYFGEATSTDLPYSFIFINSIISVIFITNLD